MEGTKINLVARTYDLSQVANPEEAVNNLLADSTVFSGKAAGVCYMPDNYMEVGIQDESKAINRAKNTDTSTHHSVYGHMHVTFEIKSNKMIAMILNSLGCNETSEKSARYTKMHPDTELELELYNKWILKIQELVLRAYPWYDDSALTSKLRKKTGNEALIVDNGKVKNEISLDLLDELKKDVTLPSYKIGQENARYMISVFTPTTFLYTVSIRRVFEITHMLEKLYIGCITDKHYTNEFNKKLAPHVLYAWKAFKEVCDRHNTHDIKIRDSKNIYVRFLPAQHTVDAVYGVDNKLYATPFNDMKERLKETKSIYADTYDITEYNSLSCVAQKERHRVLNYTITIQQPGEYGWYIPKIVHWAGMEVETEWLNDIASVAYCVPQGTIVRVREQGLFEDFANKAKERMCGRAQLETMLSTREAVRNFISNSYNLSYENRRLLEKITCMDERNCGREACSRCRFADYVCTEGCQWGADASLTRLV